MIRNEQVSRFRRELLDTIYLKGMEDIEKNKDPMWRYDYYNETDYNEMLYKFWVPLTIENFYEETYFIE